MSGPWDRFGAKPQAPAAGPWAQFGEQPQQPEAPRTIKDWLDDRGRDIAGNATEEIPDSFSPEFERYTGATPMARAGAAVSALPATVFGKDSDMGAKLASQIPGSQLTQDDNGNPVIQMPDGKRFYVNQPGLDRHDVERLGAQIASYLPAGRVANKFGGLGARATAMGTGSAATNLAGQASGRDEVDPGEAAFAGAVGGAFEFASPFARFLWKTLKRKPTAEEMQEAARAAGLTPEATGGGQLPSMVQEAKAGANPAAVQGEGEFGFRYTQGQKTGDFRQLSDEEALRQSRGPAGDMMRGVDQGNRQALESNVTQITRKLGNDNPTNPSTAFGRTQGVVQRQADDLKQRVSEAYDKVRESGMGAQVRPAAIQALPKRLEDSVSDMLLDPAITPAASAALRRVQAKVAAVGTGKGEMARDLAGIETERRVLSSAIDAAGNPADRRALTLMKREYDRWMDDAYGEVLSSDKLIPLQEARKLRAQFGTRFEGRGNDVAMDNFIESMVSGGKSPDELVNIAFGMTQISKPAAARFIGRLKTAFGDSPEALDGLRAAHFMKLTTGKNGEILGAQAITNNILGTERNAGETIRQLYKPEEWSQLKRLASALDAMTPKGTFAKSSGSTERLMRMMGSMRMLPVVRNVIDAVVERSQTGAAANAMRPVSAPAPRDALIPALGAAAGGNAR